MKKILLLILILSAVTGCTAKSEKIALEDVKGATFVANGQTEYAYPDYPDLILSINHALESRRITGSDRKRLPEDAAYEIRIALKEDKEFSAAVYLKEDSAYLDAPDGYAYEISKDVFDTMNEIHQSALRKKDTQELERMIAEEINQAGAIQELIAHIYGTYGIIGQPEPGLKAKVKVTDKEIEIYIAPYRHYITDEEVKHFRILIQRDGGAYTYYFQIINFFIEHNEYFYHYLDVTDGEFQYSVRSVYTQESEIAELLEDGSFLLPDSRYVRRYSEEEIQTHLAQLKEFGEKLNSATRTLAERIAREYAS